MRTAILTLLFGFVVGSASATTWNDIDNVRALKQELARLQALDALTAQDISALRCTAETADSTKPGGKLTILPGDTGRAGVLSALDTALAAKITAIKSQLATLGVTNVP